MMDGIGFIVWLFQTVAFPAVYASILHEIVKAQPWS